ncbi:hypothetical protein PVT67_15680 [Gallaecimonas kandeliae]|uniref:hypothetical protein n=1 Tax=Gallaecimonas kandeliae TaxID=3029055 RepID=UPI0026492E38|nr:hypothetical protein [Gallaecimonas kandeliae]WKE65083.1 hypothetical protein PVT67_15680 [Gallaecimonas kandeliae]
MAEPVVTFAQLRRLRYCAPRIRAWCREHGIDARRLREGAGIPVSEVRATGCGFAAKAADLAEREAGL